MQTWREIPSNQAIEKIAKDLQDNRPLKAVQAATVTPDRTQTRAPAVTELETNDNDVVCKSLGQLDLFHQGSRRFSRFLQELEDKLRGSTVDRLQVAKKLVEDVQAQNPPGRFLRPDKSDGSWVTLPDDYIIGQVEEALRRRGGFLRDFHHAPATAAASSHSNAPIHAPYPVYSDPWTRATTLPASFSPASPGHSRVNTSPAPLAAYSPGLLPETVHLEEGYLSPVLPMPAPLKVPPPRDPNLGPIRYQSVVPPVLHEDVTRSDILVGTGKSMQVQPKSEGEVLYRLLISSFSRFFGVATGHETKSRICSLVLHGVQSQEPPGRFLKALGSEPERWLPVSEVDARLKITKALQQKKRRASVATTTMPPAGQTPTPGSLDVLMGKDEEKHNVERMGNRIYLALARSHTNLPPMINHQESPRSCVEVVDAFFSSGGRLLLQDNTTERWNIVSRSHAIEMTSILIAKMSLTHDAFPWFGYLDRKPLLSSDTIVSQIAAAASLGLTKQDPLDGRISRNAKRLKSQVENKFVAKTKGPLCRA